MSEFDSIRKDILKKYDDDTLRSTLLRFRAQHLNSENFSIENRSVGKILEHFFGDLIYEAKNKNGKYSPSQILHDDNLLTQAFDYIQRHPNFFAQKSDPANLRDFFFSSSMCGKVTNFNPVIARKIYEHYLPTPNATIFDFSCGFGSRMLGALTSPNNYNYIGVEPYKELYNRLRLFSQWISSILGEESRATIYNQGAEESINCLKESIDLSFSSPPYFNYEIYTNEPTQAYIKYPTYEEFIEGFIWPTIKNLYGYTKSGGIHIVNLEDTKRIQIVDDWLRIALEVGFELIETRSIDTTLKRKSTKNKNLIMVMKK